MGLAVCHKSSANLTAKCNRKTVTVKILATEVKYSEVSCQNVMCLIPRQAVQFHKSEVFAVCDACSMS